MRSISVSVLFVFVQRISSSGTPNGLVNNLLNKLLKGCSRALPIGPRVAQWPPGTEGVIPLSPRFADRPQLAQLATSFTRAAPRTKRLRDASFAAGPLEVRAGSDTSVVPHDDLCHLTGDPTVRIEDAPGNAVRIFTGIVVLAPMQSVWDVLTDYENLHKVVPSIVRNEVVKRYESGARLAQSASATVLPGLSFSAKTVLDVHLYQEGIPESQTTPDAGDSNNDVRNAAAGLPLVRGIFPRPYGVASLPHKDITMMNVQELPGDFEHYQGIWRVQPLPGCASNEGEATRLTYAVEVRPKGLLPVKLIENRIASDLKKNLVAIQSYVESNVDLAWRSSSTLNPSINTGFKDSSANPKADLTTSQPLRWGLTQFRWLAF